MILPARKASTALTGHLWMPSFQTRDRLSVEALSPPRRPFSRPTYVAISIHWPLGMVHPWFHLICWLLPLSINLIALLHNVLGDNSDASTSGWCWINLSGRGGKCSTDKPSYYFSSCKIEIYYFSSWGTLTIRPGLQITSNGRYLLPSYPQLITSTLIQYFLIIHIGVTENEIITSRGWSPTPITSIGRYLLT